MDIGIALPQMARGLDRDRVIAWCRGIDAGPYSSVSAGERITYHNLEGFALCNAAAILTERVRVFVNVAVAPWHAPAMLAKQLTSMDVLSGGRVDLAVGVGGREQDYMALGSSFANRHSRLDATVAELQRLWTGGLAADGQPLGPPPVQAGGPSILCSGMGPKSLARAAQWAAGVSGFTLTGDPGDAVRSRQATEQAWATAGRTDRPRISIGMFVALGPDAEPTLRGYASDYFTVFGVDVAKAFSEAMTMFTANRLTETISAFESAGCDEIVIIPADSDPAMLDRIDEAVSR